MKKLATWVKTRSNTFWLQLSPVFVAVALLVVSLAADEATALAIVSPAWLAVALVSSVFAELTRRRTRRAVLIAREELEPEDPLRALIESNNFIAITTEIVHAIFALIGLTAVLLDQDSELRILAVRNGVLIGQYLLFVVVARTYFDQRTIEAKLNEIENDRERERN